MTTETPGRAELVQSNSNALQMPVFIAVIIAAIVISQMVHGPSAVVLAVCGVALVLDALLVRYVLRNTKGRLIVTPDEITFSRQVTSSRKGPPPQQIIKRAEGSTLTFRTGRNGLMGSQYTGYVLKLRDTATGDEVYAGAFGRAAVRKACESQGWTFA